MEKKINPCECKHYDTCTKREGIWAGTYFVCQLHKYCSAFTPKNEKQYMTDEELKKLAREYAESVCPSDDYPDIENCEQDRIIEYDFALPVLKWLAEDYCIVPKKIK